MTRQPCRTAERIFVIAAVTAPLVGGAVSTLRSWTKYLASAGRELFVYTMTTSDGQSPFSFQDGYNKGFRSRGFRDWFYSSVMNLEVIGYELLSLADSFRPHLVVATDLYSAHLGGLLRSYLRIPFVLNYHETPVPPGKIIGRLPAFPQVEIAWSRYVFSGLSYDMLLAQSDYYLKWARECGAPEEKSVLHYFGVDTELFQPSIPMPAELEKYIPGLGYVFCPCRVVPRKRIGDLIDAMPTVLERRPGLKFVFTWYTDDAPVEYTDNLLAQIESLSLTDSVICLPPIPHDLMPALYAHAVVTVLPSQMEGLGLSLLESQACGTPVIGTDVPGIRETVSDGGLLISPGDVAALAGAILRITGDPLFRHQLGICGRRRMEIEFSQTKCNNFLLALFDSLVAKANITLNGQKIS